MPYVGVDLRVPDYFDLEDLLADLELLAFDHGAHLLGATLQQEKEIPE